MVSENFRFRPVRGLRLESFGCSFLPLHTQPCCTRFPATAATTRIANGASNMSPSSWPRNQTKARSLRASVAISWGTARKWARRTRMPLATESAKIAITNADAAIMNQVLTSWLLATSPRLRDSPNRLPVAASVF